MNLCLRSHFNFSRKDPFKSFGLKKKIPNSEIIFAQQLLSNWDNPKATLRSVSQKFGMKHFFSTNAQYHWSRAALFNWFLTEISTLGWLWHSGKEHASWTKGCGFENCRVLSFYLLSFFLYLKLSVVCLQTGPSRRCSTNDFPPKRR